MNKIIKTSLAACSLLFSSGIMAQTETVAPIAYGDMNSWMVREINESAVIGGDTKYLYSIVKGDTLRDNTPYKHGKSPWATSSVLAKVKGVTKGSVTVFPERRGDGFCARLETRIEECKVLGLINIKVLASGTIFLGEMVEPITSTSNPQSKLVTGVPFTKRPKALQYDYKVITGGTCIKATGFGKQQKLDRKDMAEVQILLQHRWEDEKGNVYAKRVATGWERFDKPVTEWQNAHRLSLNYGDISSQSYYRSYMGLKTGEQAYYTRNSKGKMVPIQETGWADADESVTHMILQFSSSNGGAYTGNTNSRLWIDNVKLVY
ncbi:MAG: PCMD domain-containing protein [Dysgonomonas sp.]